MGSVVPALLAASACAQERNFLHNLFSGSGWEILLAETFQEVLTAVREKRAGVLLSDSRFSDGHCWKELLDEMQRLESPPMLIVSDRLADERLWTEVLNLGGYDLLSKPFDPEEVLRVASAAWAAWQRSRETALNQAEYRHKGPTGTAQSPGRVSLRGHVI